MSSRFPSVVITRTTAGRLAAQVTPTLLAGATFIAGVTLLLSGAVPVAHGRLEWLSLLLPLSVIEISHFLTSIIGVTLLVVSQGLARRLDAAYFFASMALVVGMVTSLLKGAGLEEAAILLPVLVVLWQARPAFDRRAAFFDTRFSPIWIAAMAGALGASIWLGFFAFKHVNYSHELWWQFELQADASRFLRASVGAAVALLMFGLAWLVGHAPHEAAMPTVLDLQDAERVIDAQRFTRPSLAYLRDKALLFSDDRTAFLMYGVRGRTWVALGDPVGNDDQFAPLVRRFLERCLDYGGRPAFYEVGPTHLHRYADFGLSFVKIGEEAKVDLTSFTLEGSRAAKYRQLVRRLDKEGGTFRVIPVGQVSSVLDSLRAVSNDWLAARSSAEKGFSLGFFDESYVCRFPIAVVEIGGRIVAFANVWAGPTGHELSIDMMRYHRDAPPSVMEALCVHVMLWGHEHGYKEFTLGMAPLSGVEASPVRSLWNSLGGFLYAHGDAVYHFQGLRAYKSKFDPRWEPRYLVYPGGFALARILADISALVAGGYRQIFRK